MSAAAPVLVALFFGGIMMHVMPTMSRRDIFFAVTVPYEFRLDERARQIRREYWLALWATTLLGAAIAVLGPRPGSVLLAMATQFAGSWGAWAIAHRRVKPFALVVSPSTPRVASLEPRTQGIPGGWIVAAGPLVIIGVSAVFIWMNWDRIPDRFPTHWRGDGTPNGWRTRTFWGVYSPLVMAAGVCAAMIWSAHAIGTRTRQVMPTGVGAYLEQRFKRGNAAYLVLCAYFMATLFCLMVVRPMFAKTDRLPMGVWLIFAVIMVGSFAMVAWMYRSGQGGRRLMPADEVVPPGDGTPDDGWKAGLIYYNPSDPALLVEKRVGFGWTFNFAHPMSWLFMVVILAATLGPVLVLRWLR